MTMMLDLILPLLCFAQDLATTPPLHRAVLERGAPAVQALLERGADPNVGEAAHGQTALMFAASENRVSVIEVLLAHGADPKIETNVVKLERPRVDEDGNPLPAVNASAGREPRARPQGSGGQARGAAATVM